MAKSNFCPTLWFSGFFGLGALVHLVRLIFRFSLVVAGREIPLAVSALLVVVLGAVSIGLLILAIKRPCGEAKGSSTCSK